MSTPAYDAGRLALMLNELRLPTIAVSIRYVPLPRLAGLMR